MESLPNVPILKFNPDTLQNVRKEFNLDQPERMKEALDILDDWVQKQNHFVKKDFPRDFLERLLISTKGSIERAKTRLDKYCTFKTLMPQFFDSKNIEDSYKILKQYISHAHLPKITPDNYRVYFLRFNTDAGDSDVLFTYYKYIFLLSEFERNNDYCNGFVIIMDYSNVSIMNIVTKINVVELRHALTILMEGFGMRIKGIHYITPSKMIDSLISVFKSVLSEKISKRIHVHKTADLLYDHVPKEILPKEYGGEERSLETLQEEWIKIVTSKEFQDYLKIIQQAKTDEALRPTEKFNEDCIGMPGSFRTLKVD